MNGNRLWYLFISNRSRSTGLKLEADRLHSADCASVGKAIGWLSLNRWSSGGQLHESNRQPAAGGGSAFASILADSARADAMILRFDQHVESVEGQPGSGDAEQRLAERL